MTNKETRDLKLLYSFAVLLKHVLCISSLVSHNQIQTPRLISGLNDNNKFCGAQGLHMTEQLC